MKPTNIWNPASKVLDFDVIESSLAYRGILYDFDFQDEYRSIVIPVEKSTAFGEIVIIEYYKDQAGFYFIFWGKKRKYFKKENCIYKVDAKSGTTVEEGRGLVYFEKFLADDKNLEEAGVQTFNYSSVREKLPEAFKKLLLVIDYEVKKTIRSNAEAFIESITT